MSNPVTTDTATAAQPFHLAANGTLLILGGLLTGAATGAVPYPRLMVAAHTAFLGVGTLSILAAVLFKASFALVGKRSSVFILLAHYFQWFLGLSGIAAAIWGTNKALPLAAAQAGAPGAPPWQESLVLIGQIVPALCLLVAWGLLAWGIVRASKQQNLSPS